NNIYCQVFFLLIKIASPTKQIPELKIINAIVPYQKKFSCLIFLISASPNMQRPVPISNRPKIEKTYHL
ncbi:MAG: hypothetical protein L7S72_11145, partial [Flavobacteriales bacterium]|nr:hypothetical protein [Flavobacteriales bacterium]